jgi:hypothetical protein
MIPVARVAAPAGYDRVKTEGDGWLRRHQRTKRPKDLWSPFLAHLADGFSHLCGYAAMLDPTGGTVDHYLSWVNHRHLAYEWSNFRFASYILNSSKKTADEAVLDPYLVQPGWFEIILPSLQLRMTDKVPVAQRAAAEFTLKRLKLENGEKIVRWRQQYYERYRAGQLTLEGLREIAPLIADAVEREERTALRPRRGAPKQPRQVVKTRRKAPKRK